MLFKIFKYKTHNFIYNYHYYYLQIIILPICLALPT